ncbi:DHA2 family efflux MFS transporter permease subunit [Nakamurella lactea]|uniref:DHA2 family efflux MFS transporter permease subunit n=1 Tax=Nakamurella lactea TaxID=459515 RepID=UPI0004274275|nr:DHA2 family efflux MFS transporter permease subunit [Nakamurella lactea]
MYSPASSSGPPTTEPAGPGPARRNRWIGLAVLALAVAMIVLDGTIVGVALPAIVRDLRLDLTDAQWVNSVYSVVFAALLLTSGRLGDRLGRRRWMIAGVVVFVAGSLLAAGSDTAGSLIAARLVQGIGGAMVLPSTLSSVNTTFRGKERAAAFGVWGAVMSGAAAIGPLLGGWLTSSFSWPWIFLINVPIGVLVVIGALLFVPESRTKIDRPGLDVDGLLLSGFGFGLLVFGVIEGSQLGWWRPIADLRILGIHWSTSMPISAAPVAILLGMALIALFVVWERHRTRVRRSQILDLKLFGHRTFVWGNVTAAMVAIGEFALVFVLPLYLVNVLQLTTMGAGLVLAAMAAGAFVSGAQARHLAARFGPPGVVIIGLALETGGVLLTALVIGTGTSPWLIAGLLVIYGVGLGLASAQLTSTVLADIPPEESGQGSATQSTVRQVGSALGSTIAGAVMAIGLGNSLSGGDPVVFASSTRWSLLAAAVFLAFGLIGAFRVAAAAAAGSNRAGGPATSA